MKKVIKLLLVFASGLLSGAFIHLGAEVAARRTASVGGEMLIVPLILLLIIFGVMVGRESVKRP